MPAECGSLDSLIHDLKAGGGGSSVCRVLMHVSVNFIFIWTTEWNLECSSINTLFSSKKLMAAALLGAAGRVEISRHSRRRWLTELQAAVYQLQLQLSGRRKRRVTLTADEFLTTLSEQVQGSSIKQLCFSQGILEEGSRKSFATELHVAVVGFNHQDSINK